jgi:hypothetical protein
LATLATRPFVFAIPAAAWVALAAVMVGTKSSMVWTCTITRSMVVEFLPAFMLFAVEGASSVRPQIRSCTWVAKVIEVAFWVVAPSSSPPWPPWLGSLP